MAANVPTDSSTFEFDVHEVEFDFFDPTWSPEPEGIPMPEVDLTVADPVEFRLDNDSTIQELNFDADFNLDDYTLPTKGDVNFGLDQDFDFDFNLNLPENNIPQVALGSFNTEDTNGFTEASSSDSLFSVFPRDTSALVSSNTLSNLDLGTAINLNAPSSELFTDNIAASSASLELTIDSPLTLIADANEEDVIREPNDTSIELVPTDDNTFSAVLDGRVIGTYEQPEEGGEAYLSTFTDADGFRQNVTNVNPDSIPVDLPTTLNQDQIDSVVEGDE